MLLEDQLKITQRALSALIENSGIVRSDKTTAIEALEAINDLIDGNMIAIYWTIDDVKSLADDGEHITDDEARTVLKKVAHSHDASLGISWNTLELALATIRAQR